MLKYTCILERVYKNIDFNKERIGIYLDISVVLWEKWIDCAGPSREYKILICKYMLWRLTSKHNSLEY